MGIAIANAASMPAVTYNKIHLAKLEISQPTFTDDTQQPNYQVVVCYRHYGIVGTERFYENEDVQRVAIDDFLGEGMVAAAGGDMSLITALQAIEQAVASIISNKVGNSATVI